jgi:hypothetical protein
MVSNFGPIAAALVSWIVFNSVGRPLLRFFDLRTEVRRTMILYDNVRARWQQRGEAHVAVVSEQDPTPDNFERLAQASIAIWHRRFELSPIPNHRPAWFLDGLVSMCARLRRV